MSDGGGNTGGDTGGGKGGGGGGKGDSGSSGGGFVTPGGMGPTSVSDSARAGPAVPNQVSFGGSFDAGGGGSTPLAYSSDSGSTPQLNTSPLSNIAAPASGASAAPGGVGGVPDLTSNQPIGPGLTSGNVNAFGGATFDPNTGLPQGGAATPATAGSAAPASAGAGGDTSSLKSLSESVGIKNPLGAAIGAAGLGYNILQGQQARPSTQNLEQQAAALNSQGQQLLSYLQSGNLPAGLKAQLDQATQAAKARVISNFASQGLSTDPSKNSVLAQQLSQIDQQALISTAQIGQNLMTTGLQESGLSSDLYKTLSQIDQTQTANIGRAIANFASSLNAGGGNGINIKLGSQ